MNFGLKIHINRIWIYLGIFSLFLLIAGYAVGGRYGLLFGFFAAASLDSLIFFYPDFRLLKLFPTHLLEGQDPWGVLTLTEKLAHKAGVIVPQVFVIQLDTPTTFSTGTAPHNSSILISEGLLNTFSSDEIETALTIEIVRIKRSDTLATTVGAAIVSLLSVNPLRFISAPLIGLLLRIPSRRKDFLNADREAADLLGSRERVAQLLWKIRGIGLTKPFVMPPAYAHLFTVSPLTTPRHHSYFSLQPSVEKRIRNLVGHWPI